VGSTWRWGRRARHLLRRNLDSRAAISGIGVKTCGIIGNRRVTASRIPVIAGKTPGTSAKIVGTPNTMEDASIAWRT